MSSTILSFFPPLLFSNSTVAGTLVNISFLLIICTTSFPSSFGQYLFPFMLIITLSLFTLSVIFYSLHSSQHAHISKDSILSIPLLSIVHYSHPYNSILNVALMPIPHCLPYHRNKGRKLQ